MFNLSKRALKIFQSLALSSPIYSCHKRRPLHPDQCPPIKCLTPTHPQKVLNYSKPATDSSLEGSCRSGQTQSLHQNLCWKLKSDFASHDVSLICHQQHLQASPILSPSVSFWSGFRIPGQLSHGSPKPSPEQHF